jgi:hypothetical protein
LPSFLCKVKNGKTKKEWKKGYAAAAATENSF